MAPQPKRKSPEKTSARARKPPPSRTSRMLHASTALIARYPRAIGGLACFGIVFSFVAANALWYQPRHHPAPLLATRMFEDEAKNRSVPTQTNDEPGVTTFRIERQSDLDANKAAARADASPLVRDIQTALAARGLYDGVADGLTGPKTDAAILFFQQTEGMDETGQASQALLDRLKAVAEEKASADIRTSSTTRPAPVDEVAALIAQSGDTTSEDKGAAVTPVNAPVMAVIPAARPISPAVVMEIQKGLVGMAYGDVKIDGIAGDATRAAIRAFEKNYRLKVTGEPSQRVLDKMKSIGAV